MPIIKSIYWNQSNPEIFIYKYPFNNITLGSVLTVQEGQQAYFYKNGCLYDSFEPGRHTLSSANLPLLQKIINLPSGGETTFLAIVYFVSTLDKRNMFWGLGGMRIIDPYFEIPIKVSARGQYGIRITDGALFIQKFVGSGRIANSEFIEEQFRIDISESVKVSIATYMKDKELNINELGTEYKALAELVAKNLETAFDAYGIEIINFNIEDISFDEEDEGYKQVMAGISERTRLKMLGTSYTQNRQIDIAQTAAANSGSGVFSNIGLGMSIGNKIGETVQNVLSQDDELPPPPPQSMFYVGVNGKTTGPYSCDKIAEMLLNGEMTELSYVCKRGKREWVYVKDEAELKELLPPPPPPMPDML